MTPRIRSWARLAGGLLLAGAASAFASGGDAKATTTSIVNCVGADRIAFEPGQTGTVLEPADRDRVQAEMFDRYPMLERDGLVPAAIVLWHRPRGEWLYATLLDDPGRPGAWCFAAHVVANGLALTPRLMKKYFPANLQAL